jgi:geranylgeranylglycerol-phosphate geranylgeranyltransferase
MFQAPAGTMAEWSFRSSSIIKAFQHSLKKLSAFFALLRPGNLLVAGISVIAGGIACRAAWREHDIWLAAIAVMLVAGAGNALNDYFDIEIDRINRPHRPLPQGSLPPAAALVASVISFALACVLGFTAGRVTGFLIVVMAVLLASYAIFGKRLALAGNLLVGSVAGLAFIAGGTAGAVPQRALFPALFALLMHGAREIVKDIQDEAGDLAGGARTTAVVFGRNPSLTIAAGMLSALFLITPLPFLAGHFNRTYLIIALALVNTFLLWAVRELLSNPDPARIARLSLFIKLDMLAGLAAIVAGSV